MKNRKFAVLMETGNLTIQYKEIDKILLKEQEKGFEVMWYPKKHFNA